MLEEVHVIVATSYLRHAEDMKLYRLLCSQFKEPLRCLYVGVATGEDFWSWLVAHMGIVREVHWTGIDIDAKAAEHVRAFAPAGVNIITEDYRKHTGEYDVIVANHIWTQKLDYDDHAALLRMKPKLLFCRDHGLLPRDLMRIFTGYKLYINTHNNYRYLPHTLAVPELALKLKEAKEAYV